VDVFSPLNNLDNLSDNLSTNQLSSIKAQLDLVLMAIEALTNLGSDAVLLAAKDLQLSELLGDRVSLWWGRGSTP
jgi:Protein of unknown function (DUF3038)